MSKHTNSTPKRAVTRGRDWTKTFLKSLADCGNVTIACRAACVDRVTAYTKRRTDEAFGKAWSEALQEAGDLLEAEARRRAERGVDEPVVWQGKLMGCHVNEKGEAVTDNTPGAKLIPLVVKKYSDVLLMFLLKGIRPRKFRDNATLEHTGPRGGPVTIDVSRLSTDDLASLRAIHNRIATTGSN